MDQLALLNRTDTIILCSIVLTAITALVTWATVTVIKAKKNKKD